VFAIALQRDSCIAVHSEAAVKRGATKEEPAEALVVAFAVNARAALVYSARALVCGISRLPCRTQQKGTADSNPWSFDLSD
jgi:hypothetical protein